MFTKDHHQNAGNRPAGQKLYERELDHVHVRREPLDHQDMHRVHHGAREREQVAEIERERRGRVDGQEIQPDKAEQNADPHRARDPLAEEEPENGHEKHIERGDERDLSRGSIIERKLLEIACRAEREPDEETSR